MRQREAIGPCRRECSDIGSLINLVAERYGFTGPQSKQVTGGQCPDHVPALINNSQMTYGQAAHPTNRGVNECVGG